MNEQETEKFRHQLMEENQKEEEINSLNRLALASTSIHIKIGL